MSKTGAVSCSGSLSLDLPPGVGVVGGRRTLSADVDYVVQQAADGSGRGHAAQCRRDHRAVGDARSRESSRAPRRRSTPSTRMRPRPRSTSSAPRRPSRTPAQPARPAGARRASIAAMPARRGEIAVCADAGWPRSIATWPRNIGRSMSAASPDQQAIAAQHARPLPRLPRPLPDQCLHRRCLYRADARDPRHHGRPLAAAIIVDKSGRALSSARPGPIVIL